MDFFAFFIRHVLVALCDKAGVMLIFSMGLFWTWYRFSFISCFKVSRWKDSGSNFVSHSAIQSNNKQVLIRDRFCYFL